jgi:hypothetical protein
MFGIFVFKSSMTLTGLVRIKSKSLNAGLGPSTLNIEVKINFKEPPTGIKGPTPPNKMVTRKTFSNSSIDNLLSQNLLPQKVKPETFVHIDVSDGKALLLLYR